jgi:hypothetical protein
MTPDPRVATDFPGGNGAAFEWAAPDQLRFAADLHGGPCSMWFHFRVEDPACEMLHVELTNGKTALGWPYRPYVRPVFRHPDAHWQRTPPTVTDAATGRFAFDVACGGGTTEIAYCHPYPLADWESFFNATLQPAGTERIDLGLTGLGRPYFACRLGHGPKVVWAAARAHAGETPGSYVLEGLLTEFAEAHDPAFSVIAMPFLDLDGVVEGMYGKNRPPVDFNRAWHIAETRPEIRACKTCLAALPHPPLMAVDLHAPTPYDSNYISYSGVGLDTARATLLARLVGAIAEECEKDPGCALDPAMTGSHPEWFPQGEQHTQCGYFKHTYGALAFALENAYHSTHCGTETGPSTWRRMGRILARQMKANL